jgi:hypothetical protein
MASLIFGQTFPILMHTKVNFYDFKLNGLIDLIALYIFVRWQVVLSKSISSFTLREILSKATSS